MPSPTPRHHPTLAQTYGERSEALNLTPLATYLLRLMHIKRTNLCVSADVSTASELLQLAQEIGDQICVLKTHADIVKDWTERTAQSLAEIARSRHFVIFEDRKFGDIGNTVQQQYIGGTLSIARWAHIVNAHLFPGPAIITALAEGAKKAIAAHNTSVQTSISASPIIASLDGLREEEEEEDDDDDDEDGDQSSVGSSEVEEETERDRMDRKQSVVSVSTTISTQTETISPRPSLRPSISRGASEDSESGDAQDQAEQLEELGPPPFYRSLLLLAQMSSKDNMLNAPYTSACVAQARANRDFVMGFIAQSSLNSEDGDNFITMTPGVQLSAGGDALGQQYNTPQTVVGAGGSDIIIVGRGVLEALDRRRAAHEYRKQGWAAYESRLRMGRKKR